MPLHCFATLPLARRSPDRPRSARRRSLLPRAESLEARAQPGALLTSPLDSLASPVAWLASASQQPISQILPISIDPQAAGGSAAGGGAVAAPAGPVGIAALVPAPDPGFTSTSSGDTAAIAGPPVVHGADVAERMGIGAATKDDVAPAGDKGLSPGTPPGGTSQNPPGSTPISGPGSFPIRTGSVVCVTDKTVSGDANALWWDAPSGTPINQNISNWGGVVTSINGAADGSLTDLFISGHGDADGGSATTSGGLDSTSLSPGDAGVIRQKLAPGGRLVVLSCGQGGNAGMQNLANQLGVPVIGNTGTVSSGTYGKGDWIRFDPKTGP